MDKSIKSILTLATVTIVLLFVIILILSFIGYDSSKKAENYQQQLIAVCGAVDEARQQYIVEVFVYSEKFRKGVISFSTVEDQKDFVFTRRYNISPNGDLTIYKDDSRGEQVIKKTWEDYPEFHSISKK